MWLVEPNGSVVDQDGKIILFSTDRFVREICEGNCCFICGAHPDTKPFNNEHILPDWILRRYNLYNRAINLPNGEEYRYDRYTIPCCAECNALMGREIEEPISKLIGQGYSAITNYLTENGHLIFFVWAALIYLKTHLRDTAFRYHQDRREGDEPISDIYDWEHLHHLHTVVRCFYTGAKINPAVMGSFVVLPAKRGDMEEGFDFADLYLAQSLLLRLDNIAFLIVFNDSGASFNGIVQAVKRITGPVSGIQLRELLARLASFNIRLKSRPVYSSNVNLEEHTHTIDVELAERPEFTENGGEIFGRLMQSLLSHVLAQLEFAGGEDRDSVIQHMEEGNWTFLFNDEGEFLTEQFVPIDDRGTSVT